MTRFTNAAKSSRGGGGEAWCFTGPQLPEDVVSIVLGHASACWSHRRVARAWAQAAVAGIMTQPRSANFSLNPWHIGLHDSAIYYYSAVLLVQPTGTNGSSPAGQAELQIWREAGEPYGPQSDRLMSWLTLWTLDPARKELVCSEWTAVTEDGGLPGEFDVIDTKARDWLPRTLEMKGLLQGFKPFGLRSGRNNLSKRGRRGRSLLLSPFRFLGRCCGVC